MLRSELSAKDKALVLLYGAAGSLTAREIAQSIEYGNVSQFRTSVLKKAHKSDLIHFDTRLDTVTLSPLGAQYVERHIPLTVL